MSRHLSVRVGDDLFEQLEAQSRRSGQTRSAVAKQLLEEGLRMEQHPGIVFRSGPGGRRAGLIGGPDVWEVVGALRGADGGDADSLASIGERTGLTADQWALPCGTTPTTPTKSPTGFGGSRKKPSEPRPAGDGSRNCSAGEAAAR